MYLEVKNLVKPSDFVFLLGGHDLEMVEIGKILKAKDLTFHDRNLHWGAKLSAYQDLIDESHTFVGVELVKDIPPPKQYIEIDHHYQNSGTDSTLEQSIGQDNLDCKKHIIYEHLTNLN